MWSGASVLLPSTDYHLTILALSISKSNKYVFIEETPRFCVGTSLCLSLSLSVISQRRFFCTQDLLELQMSSALTVLIILRLSYAFLTSRF